MVLGNFTTEDAVNIVKSCESIVFAETGYFKRIDPLNKTEIIGISSKKKLDQDKSFNDISAYYRAQNKLIDDLLNEENDMPILDKKTRDRSLNLKPILDKDLSGIGLAANDISCIDDPILKSFKKFWQSFKEDLAI